MKRLIVICCTILISISAYGQVAPNVVPDKNASVAPQTTHRPAKRQKVAPSPAAKMQHNPGINSRNSRPPAVNYTEALRRHRHERHDRTWWKTHFTTIVLVGGGYYFWDAGYWYPAFGYDPSYDTYDYDGPIYCYGNLLPDQVIYNVQRALQQLGYYSGGLTGSLGPSSRAAVAAFQEDNGLAVTGAIDAPTVEALGLY